MSERIAVVIAGFVLDMIFGDPHWLYHPVRAIGKCIEVCERIFVKLLNISWEREKDILKKRIAGILIVIVVLLFSVGVPFIILYAAGRINFYLKTAIECIMCYQLLAAKSLKNESMKVYYALEKGDIEGARQAVSMIVGRDTKSLDEEGITKAAVETVAENTSDGVIAPLLFIMCFGVLGGFFYKAVNTMDSMIGYRNDKYCYLGTAAARLDDIVNFIPARISAVFMIVSAFILRLDYKNALRIFKRDRYKHKSPNSAQTEAVCAGALNVELAGNAYYFGKLYVKPVIGDRGRKIEVFDIVRANRLMYCTAFVTVAVGAAVLLI